MKPQTQYTDEKGYKYTVNEKGEMVYQLTPLKLWGPGKVLCADDITIHSTKDCAKCKHFLWFIGDTHVLCDTQMDQGF